MKYILLTLLLAFSLGCQTVKTNKQARKGWKRVDQEWFGVQARKGWKRVDKEWLGQQAEAQKVSSPKTDTNRTPSSVKSGEFICEIPVHYKRVFSNEISEKVIGMKISKWTNENCDANKNISISSVDFNDDRGIMSCCIKK